MRALRFPLLAAALMAASLWAGCDSEPGVGVPNQPPNTRLSAGPPELSDWSFEVNLFWFGWDDDGFVDHYEVAWETPDDWQGPIFGNDSLFVVAAQETCCVDPLPEFGSPLPDSVYSQMHTVYLRAVDNDGNADETPAFRTFNAKTIAPYTEIVPPSPADLLNWSSRVIVNWEGHDDDGVVVGYKYALTTLDDYLRDTGQSAVGDLSRVIAWLDTITYFPDFSGHYFTDSLVWHFTTDDSILFPNVTATIPPNKIVFGVRAVDNAGAEEKILQPVINTRVFGITNIADGPNLRLNSNILGTWSSGQTEVRDVFAGQGLRFEWRASPGPSGAPVAGFSHAVDDTAQWSPFSLADTEYPVQPTDGSEELWFPERGAHTFFVRAIDAAGFIKVLAAKLQVYEGPRLHEPQERYILVVLDTNPETLQTNALWPLNFETVENDLITYWFEGYDVHRVETHGSEKVRLQDLDFASSVFWFHSTFTDRFGGDASMLEAYHKLPPNPLPSYVASGGNFFLCGLCPSNATRYSQNKETGDVTYMGGSSLEVNFQTTLTDTTLLPHWMASQFGISRIAEAVKASLPPGSPLRLRVARSQVTGGSNPYPDLFFDPLTYPQGPIQRGFIYYDRGIVPIDSTRTEPIYRLNDSSDIVAVRRLTSPGVNGNLVYVGFHPYFIERSVFRDFLRAVLTDFGEFPE